MPCIDGATTSAQALGCVHRCSRVGVKCPHIWVFGKIAYLPTPRPTRTTSLVQSKQPTYLPPLPPHVGQVESCTFIRILLNFY